MHYSLTSEYIFTMSFPYIVPLMTGKANGLYRLNIINLDGSIHRNLASKASGYGRIKSTINIVYGEWLI